MTTEQTPCNDDCEKKLVSGPWVKIIFQGQEWTKNFQNVSKLSKPRQINLKGICIVRHHKVNKLISGKAYFLINVGGLAL